MGGVGQQISKPTELAYASPFDPQESIDGIVKFFRGQTTDTVNTGTQTLPTLAGYVAQLNAIAVGFPSLNQLNQIQQNVVAEANTRQTAVATLTASIAAEMAARIAAPTALLPANLIKRGNFSAGTAYNNASSTTGKTDYVVSVVDGNGYLLIGPSDVYTNDPSTDPTNWLSFQVASQIALSSPITGSGADLVAKASQSIATIAALRAYPMGLLNKLAVGQKLTMIVREARTGSKLGGGAFDWNPNSTLTDDGGITVIKPAGNSANGCWERVDTTRLYLNFHELCDTTGTTFNDVPMAALIAAIGPNGTGYLASSASSQAPMVYKMAAPINKPGSFEMFSLVASSSLGHVLDFSSANLPDNRAIYIQGGSGGLCNARWYGIHLKGKPTVNAVEIDGQGGFVMENCKFSTFRAAWLAHNRTSGGFTEFNVLRNCLGDYDVPIAIEYRRTNGNDSFHGTGIEGGLWINQSLGSGLVLIAGPLSPSKAVTPYNCPMSFKTFLSAGTGSSPGSALFENYSITYSSFFGHITMENGGASSPVNFPNGGIGSAFIFYVGTATLIGEFDFNMMYLCEWFQSAGPQLGNINTAQLKPWTIQKTLSSSLTTAFNTGFASGNAGTLFDIQVFAANYVYRQWYRVENNGYGGTGVAYKITQGLAIDNAGYGAPVVAVDANGNVSVSNSNYPSTGVTLIGQVCPQGAGYPQHFKN